ncbi:uncharacterized protein HMPREF1541_09948 [Cyphellophora europaea CBS 101466]|uniref:DASH complex subunit DAD3 n=1 Tax=Cyphellophora europaea (strain CBS 101466) TaxID=1220924 RepID=W2S8R8_CYPE1|nr:uncharacterized protein HMPREF1541_09948 [Cyphellophora europaea CBS 101466]ETN45072.1 hypothetical protein HMPREF1541_09948 [Cyphellophora europaea CBS 101466]
MDDDTIRPEPANSLLNLTGASSSGVTPLEQEVLDEYERLLRNMNQLSSTLSTLSSGPVTLEIAEGLRLLERKVASVYTLMKASVYSIVLQQGQIDGEGESENGTDTGSRGDEV